MRARVRMIVRTCEPWCSRRGAGIDACPQSGRARNPDTCQWHAELADTLDEPEGLQELFTPSDTVEQLSKEAD